MWLSPDLCATSIANRTVQFARVPNPGQGYCLAYALATLLTGEASWSKPRAGHDRSVPAYDPLDRQVVWSRPLDTHVDADGVTYTPPAGAKLADFGQVIADNEVEVAFDTALTDETLPLFYPGIDPSSVPLLLAGVGWVGISPDPVIPSIANGFILRLSGTSPSAVTHFEAFLPLPQAAMNAATGRIVLDFRPPQVGQASLMLNYWSLKPVDPVPARDPVSPAVTLFAAKHALPVDQAPAPGSDTLTVLTEQAYPTDQGGVVDLPPQTKALLRIGSVWLAYRSVRFGAAIQSIPAAVLAGIPDTDLSLADLHCYIAPLPSKAQRTQPKPAQTAATTKNPKPVGPATNPSPSSQPSPPPLIPRRECPPEFNYLDNHRQDHRESNRTAAYPAPYSSAVAPCSVVDRCGLKTDTSALCLAHGRVCSVVLPRPIPARYAARAC